MPQSVPGWQKARTTGELSHRINEITGEDIHRKTTALIIIFNII
ncbi:hypothetical protein HMPREF0880_01475 [Yokenella regensburgei ATCC 43003]|nr:hypothetical protein HMPREF0880_01475 [Yokenella regensburgei ATCC 43003]